MIELSSNQLEIYILNVYLWFFTSEKLRVFQKNCSFRKREQRPNVAVRFS